MAAFSGTTLSDPEILDLHEHWYRSFRLSAQKKKDLLINYTAKRSDIITQATSAITEARESVREQRYIQQILIFIFLLYRLRSLSPPAFCFCAGLCGTSCRLRTGIFCNTPHLHMFREKEKRLQIQEEYRKDLHMKLCLQREAREESSRENEARLAEEAAMRADQALAESIQALEVDYTVQIFSIRRLQCCLSAFVLLGSRGETRACERIPARTREATGFKS